MPLFCRKDLIYLLALTLLSSCAPSTYNLENNIGLYKVIDSECNLTEGLFNPCHGMRFIEIAKGQFYGIGPDQLALVFWHSETNDPEIEYTASLLLDHKQKLREGNKIWLTDQLSDNESEKSFFIIESGIITDYIFQLQRKNMAGKVLLRNFHYKLSPVNRSEIKEFMLNYPEH